MERRMEDNTISMRRAMRFLFMPGSYIGLKKEFDRNFGKMSNLMYVPAIFAECARLTAYGSLIKPLYELMK